MNINLHLSGELEAFINGLVARGLAANKTEAIRLAVTRYYEEQQKFKKRIENDPFDQAAIESAWNNPSDEKASGFYKKRYLK
ncbi:MAG: hypothetical protein V1827_02050 [Candidatus Micrarchaeota archaeon]